MKAEDVEFQVYDSGLGLWVFCSSEDFDVSGYVFRCEHLIVAERQQGTGKQGGYCVSIIAKLREALLLYVQVHRSCRWLQMGSSYV